MKVFVQDVTHIVPPVNSPVSMSDLNLVLSVFLKPILEPIRDISLCSFTRKVAFRSTVCAV